MAEEIPLHDLVYEERDDGKPGEYDEGRGEALAKWVHELLEHDAEERKKQTKEDKWARRWEAIKGDQWEGPLPTFRRPIVVNAWRRAHHVVEATLLGGRPTVKLVPQGGLVPPEQLKVWQDALWAVLRKEHVMEVKYPDASSWALVGDGGWFKIGYGRWGQVEGEPEDVMISAPHPGKIFVDPDCTDPTLTHASHILYREVNDLSHVSSRYTEGWRVKPDQDVSDRWSASGTPDWALHPNTMGGETIAPAGGWRVGKEFRRGKCITVECWIDDPTLETFMAKVITGVDSEGRPADIRDEKQYRRRYPFGRTITCSKDVTLRDIPNPWGEAFGWAMRWPFVYLPGAIHPSTLWRPGLLADHEETQRAINKSMSLLLENYVKVTNALVVADESAMDDEDWDVLSLIPGGKYRKRPGTDFSIIFPQGLPPHAFQFPDYMIRKLDEMIGIHDPPISPGQSVAAKTVAFMQQKGAFLLGLVAMMGDNALERLGARIVALQRSRYLPGRTIPYFEGETIADPTQHKIVTLPQSVQLRVEATSAYQELMMAGMAMASAGAEAEVRAERRAH